MNPACRIFPYIQFEKDGWNVPYEEVTVADLSGHFQR